VQAGGACRQGERAGRGSVQAGALEAGSSARVQETGTGKSKTMASRKLQAEIEKVLKKIAEGVEVFEGIFSKIQTATTLVIYY
jgi:hypothetical protein